MATTKTKGTNAKIKELKVEKPEKITKEQLDKVQEVVNTMNRANIEIGSMELRKHEMLHQLAGIKDELSTLQEEFDKQYGTIDINIQDGTINYEEDVKADS
jgi:allophanate hydrolase subunit 1